MQALRNLVVYWKPLSNESRRQLIRERWKVLLFYSAAVLIKRGQLSFNVSKYLFTNIDKLSFFWWFSIQINLIHKDYRNKDEALSCREQLNIVYQYSEESTVLRKATLNKTVSNPLYIDGLACLIIAKKN